MEKKWNILLRFYVDIFRLPNPAYLKFSKQFYGLSFPLDFFKEQ